MLILILIRKLILYLFWNVTYGTRALAQPLGPMGILGKKNYFVGIFNLTCFEVTGWLLPGGRIFFLQTLAIHIIFLFSAYLLHSYILMVFIFKVIPMSNLHS